MVQNELSVNTVLCPGMSTLNKNFSILSSFALVTNFTKTCSFQLKLSTLAYFNTATKLAKLLSFFFTFKLAILNFTHFVNLLLKPLTYKRFVRLQEII